MPEQARLRTAKRTVFGKHVKTLRSQGLLPGNVYGRDTSSLAIQLDAHEFEQFLTHHHNTAMMRLDFGKGTPAETAIVRHVERAPVTGKILHVDFMRIVMSQPIKARIHIELTGEAPAVKTFGGMLLHQLDSIEVEALPGELPESVKLDVSQLTELKSTLHVSDLQLPPSVRILTDADEPVAKIEPPRTLVEEVPAAAEEPVAAANTEPNAASEE